MRVPGKDFDTLEVAGKYSPDDMWSDGVTMWVTTGANIYAFDMTTKARVPGKDFALVGDNYWPAGIWSDGVTIWVMDAVDDKIYAYNMPPASGAGTTSTPRPVPLPTAFQRNPAQDFDTLLSAGNREATGIWSDGVTMWVADTGFDTKIYAYDRTTKQRVPGKDFETLAAGNGSPRGIWSDGVTIWVVDERLVDAKIYAYDMTTKARVPGKDFALVADNFSPKGIWSDGVTMWVVDWRNSKIYAYDMTTKARVPGKDFALVGDTFWPMGIWSDGVTMWVVGR